MNTIVAFVVIPAAVAAVGTAVLVTALVSRRRDLAFVLDVSRDIARLP